MDREELELLFVYQLIELAEQEGVVVSKYWKKDKIIDEILGYKQEEEEIFEYKEEAEEIEEPHMSVRVKRLKELNRS